MKKEKSGLNLCSALQTWKRLLFLITVAFSTTGFAPAPPGTLCPTGATCAGASSVLATAATHTWGCDLGLGGLGGDQFSVGPGEGVVGFDHFTRGERLLPRGGCDKITYAYRTGFQFNKQFLNNFVRDHGLLKGSFRFVVPKSQVNPPRPVPSRFPFSCVAHLGAATSNWVDSRDSNALIPYESIVDIPYRVYAPYSDQIMKIDLDATADVIIVEIDVTRTLRKWALDPASNQGFVLAGNNEGDDPDNNSCESWIQTPWLILFPFR